MPTPSRNRLGCLPAIRWSNPPTLVASFVHTLAMSVAITMVFVALSACSMSLRSTIERRPMPRHGGVAEHLSLGDEPDSDRVLIEQGLTTRQIFPTRDASFHLSWPGCRWER
jgi:hypothetical protein